MKTNQENQKKEQEIPKIALKQEVSARIRAFNLDNDLVLVADFLGIPTEELTINRVINEAFMFTARIARERIKRDLKALTGILPRNLTFTAEKVPISA